METIKGLYILVGLSGGITFVIMLIVDAIFRIINKIKERKNK